jgi:ribosomal RNA-processing protein 12
MCYFSQKSNKITKAYANTCVKVRLACIKQVVLQLDVKEYHKFVPSVLADIIIGTKDSGVKSRNLSEDTLKIIGNTLSQNNNIREFFVMLVAGLAGQTTLMISSSLIVLGKMLKEFSSNFP